ncbi:nitroreductase family protein [Helcococcus bovis]|uniref:nitroreductase family protein n=1 Tax=Helcococcus bovis TaxID=3153252 RepID=UPI0038B72C0D
MKNFVKKILPVKMQSKFREIYMKRKLNKIVNFDKNNFFDSSYALGKKNSLENLRAKITFHYHSIEKGLSNANLRYAFGKKKFDALFDVLDLYVSLGYPTDDLRFQQSLSTISSYVKLHEDTEYDISFVTNRFEKLKKYMLPKLNNIGGYGIYNFENDLYKKMDFKDFMLNRHSVRDYGKKEVDEKDVLNAIELAIHSPSACNRQSWKVHYVKDIEKVKKIISIQRGLTSNAENIQGVLIVTTNNEYYNWEYERNLGHVDGALFSMSLMMSLNYYNIANCPLSAGFAMDQEIGIREVVDIENKENIVLLISIGSFPKQFKYAKSPRETLENVVKIYK